MPDPKQTLNIAQKQVIQQRLTKQQLIMFELLACTDQSLEQRVTEEVQANPAFDDEAYTAGTSDDDHNDDYVSTDEEDTDNSEELSPDELEDVMQGDDGYYEGMDAVHVANHNPDATPQYEATEGATDYLKNQLSFRNLSDSMRQLCDYLIDCLDDNGFLARNSDDIVDDYFNVYGIGLNNSDVSQAIQIIRTLEPVGVGARDTQDCLLMQLSSMQQTDETKLLTTVLNDCYRQLVSQSFDSIKNRLQISDNLLKGALAILNSLNPKPLLSFQDNTLEPTATVIPEFIINVFEGKISVSLTGAKLPPLKLSDEYLRMSGDKDSQVSAFAKKYIDMANDFIEALQMRQQTMMKIMLAIVARQRDYFLTGDNTSLIPMVLQDISDDTSLDQSTVSRVTSNKYVQTPFGVTSLKSLFTLSAKSNEGESVSRNKVISVLKDLIDAEDKSNPLSDDQLSDLMSEKGYVVKRRTISKYRGELGIGTAQMRKVLK